MRANLDQLVERFQSAGRAGTHRGDAPASQLRGALRAEFQRLYEDVAKKRGAPLMPFFLDGVGGNPRLNQMDGMHPTAEGYRLIVDRLWPYLARCSGVMTLRGRLLRSAFANTMGASPNPDHQRKGIS